MSNAFNSWVWWAEAKTDASHGREVGERVCVCVCLCAGVGGKDWGITWLFCLVRPFYVNPMSQGRLREMLHIHAPVDLYAKCYVVKKYE